MALRSGVGARSRLCPNIRIRTESLLGQIAPSLCLHLKLSLHSSLLRSLPTEFDCDGRVTWVANRRMSALLQQAPWPVVRMSFMATWSGAAMDPTLAPRIAMIPMCNTIPQKRASPTQTRPSPQHSAQDQLTFTSSTHQCLPRSS